MQKFNQAYHRILQSIQFKQNKNVVNEQRLTWNYTALDKNLQKTPTFYVSIPMIFKRSGRRNGSYDTWYQSSEPGTIFVPQTRKFSTTPKKIKNWIEPFEIAYTVTDEFNHERNFFERIGDKFVKPIPSQPVIRFMVDDIRFDIQNGINSVLKEYTNQVFKYKDANLYPQVKINPETGIISLDWAWNMHPTDSEMEKLLQMLRDNEWEKKIEVSIDENIKSTLRGKIKLKLEQMFNSKQK